jgi:Tol biopolymer transport system component
MNLAHGKARRLTQLPDAEIRDLVWSPDGRRLAFVAGEVPEED